jgi:hypothetical protein
MGVDFLSFWFGVRGKVDARSKQNCVLGASIRMSFLLVFFSFSIASILIPIIPLHNMELPISFLPVS